MLGKQRFLDKVATLLLHFPLLRGFAIACLNIMYSTKFNKKIFERYFYNPYFIPSLEITEIIAQVDDLRSKFPSILGKTFLELGPGADISIACFLLKYGAKKIFLIDSENHIFPSEQDLKRYRDIYPAVIGSDGKLNPEKIEIIDYQPNGQIPLEKECIDIIYSLAVFEHVSDPEQLIQETYRILRDEGYVFHQIDFRDHIFQQTSLFFLFVPEALYHFLFSNTGMWTNRIRYSSWVDLFESNSYLIINTWKSIQDSTSLPRTQYKKLSLKYSNEDVLTSGCGFLCQKIFS